MDSDIVDNEGRRVGIPGGGYFVLRKLWPAMLCGIYGDPERYKETYWSRFQGCTSPVSRGSISLVQVLSQCLSDLRGASRLHECCVRLPRPG